MSRRIRILAVSGFLLIAICLANHGVLAEPPDKDFAKLFDGNSLDGWSAVPESTASDWSVRDGAIVGIGSENRQSYLVWKERDLTDFELRFEYRLLTKGNTGVEIHAQPDKTGKRPFEGYHADLGHVGIGDNVLGAWDFHFAKRKEHPCPRGTSLIITPDQSAISSKLKNVIPLNEIRKHDWNSIRIIAKGNHFRFEINDKVAAAFTDLAAKGQLTSGAIGLQLHDKGMHVEFRKLQLKKLSAAK
jgi:hypothetical protein